MNATVDDWCEDRQTRKCPGCGASVSGIPESEGEPTASDEGAEGLQFCGPACWHEWASRE